MLYGRLRKIVDTGLKNTHAVDTRRETRRTNAPTRNRDLGRTVISLAIGLAVTLMAMSANYAIHHRRLPARVAGNPIFTRDELGERPLPSPLIMLAGLINLSDEVMHETMLGVRGLDNLPPIRDKLAVIAIDEESLDRRGSWPWPRSDIARLVEKTAGAKVVGLDLLFPEPDRTSLLQSLDRFQALLGVDVDIGGVDPEELDNDLLLARRISATPTVLGMVLFDGQTSERRPLPTANALSPEAVLPDGRTVHPHRVLLKETQHAGVNINVLRTTTPPPVGEGFINLFPSPGGRIRAIPLFAHVSDNDPDRPESGVVPSLALEMMRVHLGGDAYRIDLRRGLVRIPQFERDGDNGDRHPVGGVGILKDGAEIMRIPLSELAELEIAPGSHREDFQTYPAWRVLEGMHDGEFEGRTVLIGGTAEGVGHGVSAGPDSELPVVRAHAAMLSTMMKGAFIDVDYQDAHFWQQMAILAVGLLVTLAIVFGDIPYGIIAAIVSILGLAAGNYQFFFRQGFGVGLTLPFLSTLAVLSVLLVVNYLVVGRERRFIRKAFSLNVSPSILGYLESHPDRLSSLQGEHRHMTVLFSDIRAFTSMSERLTPPDLARFLNEYFTPMSDIVMRNLGTVDKFIGDGLMAFWNAPTDNPRHARDAAVSALEMLAKLGDLQPEWSARGLPRIAIGCGINTGPMFAGYMGSEQRKNYTVMGDNVNIASRLENLNKLYSSSILITESTRAELGGEFVCRVVDKVRVSGKETAVLIHELLGMEPIGEEKVEELAAFARVFELYQEREFAAAESLLKELVFIRPTQLYRLYLDRLAIYKALPPPDDWDGTFAMTAK